MTLAWSGTRCARLGYLLGLGWDAGRIAADPVIESTAADVHHQVVRLSLTFRRTVDGSPLNLSAQRMAFFDAAAKRRRISTEQLLRTLCETVADDRYVLDNLLETETFA